MITKYYGTIVHRKEELKNACVYQTIQYTAKNSNRVGHSGLAGTLGLYTSKKASSF